MDMEEAIIGAAQGDLADVVARAGAMAALPFTSHHQQPSPSSSTAAAADHMPSASSMAGQIVNPYYEGDRRLAAAMFEAAPSTVDPYLSSSIMAPRGGYWPPPSPLTAVQISQHACSYGRDMVMTGAAAADVEGDDAMRSSQVTPAAAAAHQMMKSRKNDVKKVVCIPAPPATNNRPGGGEVIPSDLWAWRKYGQKPIKGSPYPRGYYRCSSSKGCMARKQVERSRSDPNMLVITYTAEHNHPWPMQRNVLAGYSRPHTHVSANCKRKSSCRVDYPTSSSLSPSSRNIEHNVVANGDLEYQHSTNMMESVLAVGALNTDGPMPSSYNGIQPADEVFSELEELESSNNVNANAYSREVGYDWNKF